MSCSVFFADSEINSEWLAFAARNDVCFSLFQTCYEMRLIFLNPQNFITIFAFYEIYQKFYKKSE